MTEDSIKRKLTAILCADVKGYSRMMTENEERTFHTLSDYLEIMTTIITKYRGNVFSSPGDAILAQFVSVVDAVKCAVEIQEKIEAKNVDLPENQKMLFRIGVNLGDVITKEKQIYGDGVNIAARIETLAEPGSVFICRAVYDQVHNKLEFGYEYLGEHQVKNIPNPIRVYKVFPDPKHSKNLADKKPEPSARKWPWRLAAVFLILVTGGIASWYLSTDKSSDIEPASVEKMAFSLPDKPSIAVLPFDNLSGDPEQEYFSDGLTEDIITSLSKVPEMFVIARNSTFTYKGKPVKVQQVAEDLGVRYVLEGSVRKDKDKVRITAQLLDALTGHHLWAERYDRDLKDIFALQDEITFTILNALEVKLTKGEQALIHKKGTNDLQLYLKLLQGIHYTRSANPENNMKARRILEGIISQEPLYASAYARLAYTYWLEVLQGTAKSKKDSLKKGAELAEKSLSIDPSIGDGYCLLGHISILRRDWEKGLSLLYKAVELEPNGADSHFRLGLGLCFAGRPEEAIPILKKAIRINPLASASYLNAMAIAYRMVGQYDRAIEYLETATQRYPNHLFAHLNLSACYILAGREQDAHAEAKQVLRLNSKFSVDKFANVLQLKNPEEKQRFIGALKKAFSAQEKE